MKTIAATFAAGLTGGSLAAARGGPGALLLALLAGTVCSSALGQPAATGPVDARVVAGSAAFARHGNDFTITTSRVAIINYSSFNVGVQDSVRFVQPDAQSRVLNRITNMMPTTIQGRVSANGQVYWINPAGVTFTPTATINVGQFFAAAGALSDKDFLAGVNNFTGLKGKVENYGSITAGSVNLVGAAVANYGTIHGLENAVVLASGDEVLVQQRSGGGGQGNLLVRVAGGAGAGGVVNKGEVVARRRVAFASGDIASLAIDSRGLVRAPVVTMDAPRGNVLVGGRIDASNARGVGGTVQITGDRIAIDAARIDASGSGGGGRINIGGNERGQPGPLASSQSVYVSGGSSLRADATVSGDGGRVIVWSEVGTNFQGSASATGAGASGSGGLIETSSRGSLSVASEGMTAAASGTGQSGLWLLDPSDITIQAGGATAGPPVDLFNPVGASGVVTTTDILNALATTNVTISTAAGTGGTGTITVAGSANLVYTGAAARTLTLDANTGITMNAGAVLSSSNGALSVVLNAGGAVVVNGAVATNGGVFTVGSTATGFTLGTTGSVSTSRAGGDGGVISIRPTGAVVVSGPISTNGNISGAGLATAESALPIVQISGTDLTVNSTGSIVGATGVRGGSISAVMSGNITLAGRVATTTVGPQGSFVRLSAGGVVSQSGVGVITGGALAVRAGGQITLDLANQLVANTDETATSGAASMTSTLGGITFSNNVFGSGINITPIGALAFVGDAGTGIAQTAGLTAVSAGSNIVVTSTGGGIQLVGAAVAAPVTTGTGTVTLNALGTLGTSAIAFEQNANAPITTTNLTLGYVPGGSGAALLDRANNNIGRLDANLTGGGTNAFIRLRNDASLVVGNVVLPSPAHSAGSDVAGNFLSLRSNGSVTQGAGTSIVGRGLALLGSGGFELTSTANNVSVLAASGPGNVSYRDAAGGLEIGSIDATTALTFGARGNVVGVSVGAAPDGTVGNGGRFDLRVDGGVISQSSAGRVLVDTLSVTSVGAVNLLASATNNADAVEGLVTGTNSRFRFRDVDGVAVGAAGGLTGITTNDSDVDLITGGTLVIGEAINADGTPGGALGGVSLTSDNGATQTASITANRLLLTGSGNFAIDGVNNSVVILNASVLSGASGTSIRLRSDTSLTTVEAVGNAIGEGRPGLLALTSNNSVVQAVGTTVDVQNIVLRGNGSYTLRAGAVFTTVPTGTTTLAANLGGATSFINITNIGALVVGTVDGTGGITLPTAGVNIVRFANATGTQVVPSTVTQATGAGQGITAGGLIVAGSGTISLNNALNNVGVLAGAMDTGTSVYLANTGALSVGTVGNDTGLPAAQRVSATGFTGTTLTVVNVGSMGFDQPTNLGATGGTLRFTAGAVTQGAGGAITANALGGISTAGIVLDGANDVNTVALTTLPGTGDITFNGNSGYTVGTVAGVAGWNSAADLVGVRATRGAGATPGDGAVVTLSGNGLIGQSADVAGVATGNVEGDVVRITGSGSADLGTSLFNNADALEGALTTAGSALVYADRNNLRIGHTGGLAGVLTNNGNITIRTGVFDSPRTNPPVVVGALTVGEEVSSGTGLVVIDSTGGATQTGTGRILAGGLSLLGQGAFILDTLNNDVDTLAGLVTGATSGLAFQDDDGFDIGAVGPTLGVNVGTAVGNALVLRSTGLVTQSQALVTNQLGLRGVGPTYVLSNSGNSFAVLAASTSGASGITARTGVAAQVGTVTSPDASTISGVNTGATTGVVALQSTAAFTQAAGAPGVITTDQLVLMGAGPFTLTNTGNDINRLAAGPSNVADTPSADRLTSGPASILFANANGFAVDAIDPAGVNIGVVSGLNTNGGIGLRAVNGDPITLRQNVASTGGGAVVFSNAVLLDAPGPSRTVTVNGGNGIVRFYGPIDGAVGTTNQQRLVVRSAAVPSVDLPPIGLLGSVGSTRALLSADIGGNLGSVPASSTVVFASNWLQAAGPNQHRISVTPGTGPFVVTAQESVRFGDQQKVLSFGNMTINSTGANGTVNGGDTGANRGVARFGDVSAVGDLTINADRIEFVLRAIAGAGSPSRPFGPNFVGSVREQFAENGVGPDGGFHPASDTNGADVVVNTLNMSVEPTLYLFGLAVSRGAASVAGVVTNSLFSISNPGGTSVPGYGGAFDLRIRPNPVTLAANFLPSSGPLPASMPGLDLIATGTQGAVEIRNPILVPNLPEVDAGVRLDRANREFLSRLQVRLLTDDDPAAALDRLVGISFYNNATGRTAEPLRDGPAFVQRLREDHGVSVGRMNNTATTQVRLAYENLFGLQPDGTSSSARLRDQFARSYASWLQAVQGEAGTPREWGAFIKDEGGDAYQSLLRVREFFASIETLGLSRGENAIPRDVLIEEVRPGAVPPAEFRALILGTASVVPASSQSGAGAGAGSGAGIAVPAADRQQAMAIEQRFSELFLLEVPVVDGKGVPVAGGATQGRFNAMRGSFSSALGGYAAARGGAGDAASFDAYVRASDPVAAGYLAEVRGFLADLKRLGMTPAALQEAQGKTLEMVRPNNISPEAFAQLVLGEGF